MAAASVTDVDPLRAVVLEALSLGDQRPDWGTYAFLFCWACNRDPESFPTAAVIDELGLCAGCLEEILP